MWVRLWRLSTLGWWRVRLERLSTLAEPSHSGSALRGCRPLQGAGPPWEAVNPSWVWVRLGRLSTLAEPSHGGSALRGCRPLQGAGPPWEAVDPSWVWVCLGRLSTLHCGWRARLGRLSTLPLVHGTSANVGADARDLVLVSDLVRHVVTIVIALLTQAGGAALGIPFSV